MSNLVHNGEAQADCCVLQQLSGRSLRRRAQSYLSLNYLRTPLIASVLLFILGSVCALLIGMFCHWLGSFSGTLHHRVVQVPTYWDGSGTPSSAGRNS